MHFSQLFWSIAFCKVCFEALKFGSHFLCQSLLLSTSVLSDSHVVLEVTVCFVSPPCSANKSPSVQLSTQRVLEPHCIPFLTNQVFHVFNSLLIDICMTVVHTYSLASWLVSTLSLCLVRYISSSHKGCVPQCRVNAEFRGHHVESLLGLPVPFSVHWTIIIIVNAFVKQIGSYCVITNFNGHKPVYSDDIIVITLDLGSALVSCNTTISSLC